MIFTSAGATHTLQENFYGLHLSLPEIERSKQIFGNKYNTWIMQL